jgi:lipoic acid synthetase
MPMGEQTARRFPPWLKRRLTHNPKAAEVRSLLRELRLETVCQQALCPNIYECFAKGTATFMVMGRICTRDCGFCGITHAEAAPLDEDEPRRVAEAAARLELRYVVVTSVTRDDLPDGGSHHFFRTVEAVRERTQALVEVLTPDFRGDGSAVLHVLEAGPAVFNHNVETVPRLYPEVRPQADYERSLGVLKAASGSPSKAVVKSGMMVGLGETFEEVADVLTDLRSSGCEMVTVGQYLKPTPAHLPVERFVTPEEFEEYERLAKELGFGGVASGPFVRSSYSAASLLESVRS